MRGGVAPGPGACEERGGAARGHALARSARRRPAGRSRPDASSATGGSPRPYTIRPMISLMMGLYLGQSFMRASSEQFSFWAAETLICQGGSKAVIKCAWRTSRDPRPLNLQER